ncbi:CDP-alcohol phosphatidyltransferase family protein [Methanobacterium ferruginis]|uniref:CDP-alcohol phosphatidyltransferase family protein n=1 Tax=Methanobacterium ferruginis TaxID=710191 RepID=UPI0025741997|nr:CDP-alcohol phosphatidyltransferase family protein [Methanobacterium ferruginis]BDZ67663.1 CDP-diacylglycerol--glycerol-3-phosphate 3-phosphatidyltransferase [Methanobacterium ferruginis]
MSCQSYIPNILTSVRFVAAPLFFYTFLNDLFLISASILVLALITDVLDGYIARKLDVTSDMGAYLDVTSDFVLIVACFLAYVIKGWYDPLILLLIIAMFLLFVATSGLKKPVYDPMGKYLGGYLMLMILASILFPEFVVRQILFIVLILICLTSVLTRFFFIRRSKELQSL